MPEIKLTRRYPDSKLEDITDAFFRGFKEGRSIDLSNNETLNEENYRLKLGIEAWIQLATALDRLNDSLCAMIKSILPVVDCQSEVGVCPYFDECWKGHDSREPRLRIMKDKCLIDEQVKELGIKVE